MQDDLIYAVSARGVGELRSRSTVLAPAELALLVRFDGHLTWSQVRATFPPESAPLVAMAAHRLLAGGYLQEEAPDALTLSFRADLERLTSTHAVPAAEAGLAALQRDGFYVQIAREGRAGLRRDADVPLRALVVDDDQMLAHFTRHYLALDGFQVAVAGTGEEAMAQLLAAPPDLLLLDLGLPDDDGIRILQQLRKHARTRDLPVILLTGKATRGSVIRGMAAGADGYVTKPFEPQAMLQAVHIVLGTDAGGAQRAPADPWINRDAQPRRAVRQP